MFILLRQGRKFPWKIVICFVFNYALCFIVLGLPTLHCALRVKYFYWGQNSCLKQIYKQISIRWWWWAEWYHEVFSLTQRYNNVPSRLSPLSFYGNSWTWAQNVRLHIVRKDWIVESSECSNCKQWAMHCANSERPTRDSPPNPWKCSNCTGSERNTQKHNNVPSSLSPWWFSLLYLKKNTLGDC